MGRNHIEIDDDFLLILRLAQINNDIKSSQIRQILYKSKL